MNVDWDAAEAAAARIVLAYEIGDSMADYSGEFTEMQASAVTVLMVVASFSLLQLGVNEKQAVGEFARAFRTVRGRLKKIGKDATLKELITEMHLDQRKGRSR